MADPVPGERSNSSSGAAGGPAGSGVPGAGQPGPGGAGVGAAGAVSPGGGQGGAGIGAMPAGSAGASGAVAPGAGGTGATPAGAGGSGAAASNGAYFTSGAWHGYAWTDAAGTGSTIAPPDFSGVAVGAPLCVSGRVGPAADFSGIAMLGVNLNQELLGNAPALPVEPQQAGLVLQVNNRGGSPLRVQIQGPNGATDPNQRWCAPLVGSGGFIAWDSFATACWDDSGVAYEGQPIVAVMVLVPGDDLDGIDYDFCLNELAEGDASSAGGSGGMSGMAGSGGMGGTAGTGNAETGGAIGPGDNGGSGTLTGDYDSARVTRDGRSYVVQNNVWGAQADQSVRYTGTTFEITAQSGNNATNGAPVSYPSVFIGSNYNRTTPGSNLPKRVSALTTIDTGWSHNAGSVAGTYNAAYDVWFSIGSGGDAEAPSGGYLMVWLYDPPNAQPIGDIVGRGVTIPSASGSWDVWLGLNAGRPCISYVRTSAATSLQFDLNAFIQEATGRSGAISRDWYLTNIFAGFEIWGQGAGLRTTAFYAIVN